MHGVIPRFFGPAWRRVTPWLAAGLLAACGGGGGGGGSAGTAPAITQFTYSPQGAYVGGAGSTANIAGTVGFSDPDGDLASWSLTVLDAAGRTLQFVEQPISGAGGMTSGTLSASAAVSTAELGDFTFRIELTDARGLRSAPVTGSFRVTERPWATLPGLPLPRTGFATATLSGRVYVMGGDDPASVVQPRPPIDRVDVYDPATATWSLGARLAVPMSEFVARTVGGRIVAVGAGGSSLDVRAQVYDPVAAVWTEQPAPPSAGRLASAGAVAAGRLYTLGGTAGGFDVATVESFDPAAGLWRADAALPTARRRLSAVAVDVAGSTRLFALGGYGSLHVPDAGYFRSNEAYDPAADTWAVRAPMPLPLARAAVVAFDAGVFTFGGENVERSLDAVQRYDPVADRWTARAALPAPATGLQAEVAGRRILVFTERQVWVYTPDNDLW
jgi:N-acetylneuraminic acid mutarotase